MKIKSKNILIFGLLVTSTLYSKEGLNVLPSYQGFRGAVNTPNAEVIKEGEFEFLYNNQVENLSPSLSHDFRNDKEEDNYLLNMGILPNLDFSLRYSYAKNLLNNSVYMSDRILSLKYQLPFIPEDTLQVALGVQDIGGASQYLNSKYGVVSKEFDVVRMSLGYAKGTKGSSKGNNEGALDGVFGSIEYQPLSWLQLVGEYDTKDYNGAIKSSYQTQIGKQKINIGLMAKSSLDYSDVYWGGYINMPFNNKNAPLKINYNKSFDSPFKLDDLSNIYTVVKENTLYFEYENSLYSNNDIDALGMVLGTLVTTTEASDIVVTIKKSGVARESLKVNVKEYREFLKTGVYSDNLIKFITPLTPNGSKIKKSNRFKPLLTIQPDFIIVDGSEYGHGDYTVALQAELSMAIAKGTTVSGRYNIPVAISDNFKKDEIFDYRNRNKTSADIDQLLLSQFFQIDLPYPWMNLIQVGQFDNKLNGVSFESGIGDIEGKHLLLLKLAYLEDDLGLYDMDRYQAEERKEKLLSYRYYMDNLDSNIKITGGEFLYGDRGVEIGFERFFSDISLGLDIAYTEHDYKGDNYVGRLVLSVPFGGQKRLKTDYLDIEGGEVKYTRRKTLAFRDSDTHYAQPHHLKEVENSFTLEKYYLDKNRFHPSYIKTNYNRLRNIFLTKE
jgi:hypothetical protein